jgi:hypothetical protein
MARKLLRNAIRAENRIREEAHDLA